MFFSDVCTINQNLLNNDTNLLNNCRSVAQNSLQHGIQSYIYYFTSIAIDYLTIPNIQITSVQINDL
jgi:hypothetical protein